MRIFTKGSTKNWSKEISAIDCIIKTNPWVHKIEDVVTEKNNMNFL